MAEGAATPYNNEEELSQDLTEKLLHFQEITNIEDLEECKKIMQSHQWNVERAVQSTFPGVPREEPTPAVPPQNIIPPHLQQGLRRRNVGTDFFPLPLFNPRVYEARRSVALRQPQGVFGWSYYFLSLPFRWTWITLSGVLKFFIRLFIIDPRTRVVNPVGDVEDFIKEFEELYGTRHPKFVRGSYADAQNESRRQLRFLLVYLHDPNHTNTEGFCKDTLLNNDVIELIDRNFVFWACSILKPEGYRVSKAMRENTHPFLAVICQIQGKLTIVGRLEGPLTWQEFLEQVSGLIERFQPALDAARAEKAERDMTQMLRSEQDAAYQQSLQRDKVKEEQKRKDEEMRLKKEEELAEKQRQKDEQEKQYLQRKQSCKELFVEEPDCSHPDAMKLLIKLPDGTRLTRTFLSSQPVKAIHDFIYSQDNAPRRFLVTTNFPRRIIPGCSTSEILALEEGQESETKAKFVELESDESTVHNCEESISQTGLKPSEMLFVQTVDDTDDETEDS